MTILPFILGEKDRHRSVNGAGVQFLRCRARQVCGDPYEFHELHTRPLSQLFPGEVREDLPLCYSRAAMRNRSMTATRARGLRQFLDDEQQRAWLDSQIELSDGERADFHESLEQRFRYATRFEKLLRRPQADAVLDIVRRYAEQCIPIPRTTERFYWSVSCLPSTDKSLIRVNASWMELFALLPDGDGLVARFILHLSDFTRDGSPEPDQLDLALLESCAERPEDVRHFPWKDDVFGVKVRGAASIRAFIANPRSLRAIRRFNLTSMTRGLNAYQASHCYSLADAMLGLELA
jgi:hypothetical protein